MSSEGELRYNARIPVGCMAGDNISTFLMMQHCRKRGQPVPVDQKFVLQEVSRKPDSRCSPSPLPTPTRFSRRRSSQALKKQHVLSVPAMN